MLASVTTALDVNRVTCSMVLPGELLCEAVDLHASEKVLDVASGGGAAGLAAARRGGDVVVIDPSDVRLGSVHRLAGAYGVTLRTEVAAAPHLPFEDDSFDVVLSNFAAAFIADQQRVADELVRVCRPSGRIGMANWAPGSLIGDVLRAAIDVTSPAGHELAVSWGSEDRLRELFGNRISSLRLRTRPFTFRFQTPQLMVEWLTASHLPNTPAVERPDLNARAVLAVDLAEICTQHNRADDGTLVAPSVYAEVVAVVR
jgi:SAM-dependent methyltransferase